MRVPVCRASLLLTALLALTPAMAAAQNIILEPEPHGEVRAELLLPNFDGDEGMSLDWVRAQLSLVVPVTESAHLVADVPYARYHEDRPDVTESAFGNPYLGWRVRAPGETYGFEVGLRVPLSENEDFAPFLIGTLSDLDRHPSFTRNLWVASLLFDFYSSTSEGVGLRSFGGPIAWIDTEEGRDDHLVLQYGFQLWYGNDDARLLVGLHGLWVATGEGEGIGEDSLHHAVLRAEVTVATIRPAVSLRLPVDNDWRNVMDATLGIELAVAFPEATE